MLLKSFFQNKFNQKVLGLSALLTLIIFLTFATSPYKNRFSTPLAQNPNQTGAKIYFSPSLLTLTNTPGQKTVSIIVDSNGAAMGSVNVRLSYNPQKLTNVAITFPNFQNSPETSNYHALAAPIDAKDGIISFVILSLQQSGNIKPITSLQVATLTFNVVGTFKPGDNLFSFLPKTAVYPQSSNSNSNSASVASLGGPTPAPQSILKIVEPVQVLNSGSSGVPPPPPPPGR